MAIFVVSFIDNKTAALFGSFEVQAASPVEAAKEGFRQAMRSYPHRQESISEAVVCNLDTRKLTGVGRYNTEWYER